MWTVVLEVVVFLIFVGLTTCAPLWRRRGDQPAAAETKMSYIFGSSTVGTFAMILSVARGTLGVRSFIGFPSELVYHGAAMWETIYGTALALPLVGWLIVGPLWRVKAPSLYAYLTLRFGGTGVRRAAAATFVVRQLLNLAVTLYTPCVALHAAANAPHAVTAAALATLAATATLLGGLTAAIRADVIQTLTMIAVSVVFIVQMTVKAGGPGQVIQDNVEGGRMQFFRFTWDSRTRVDTMSALFGQLFMSLSIYGCQQTLTQRYLSMSSLKAVRVTLFSCAPAVAFLFSLSWLVGMALYSLYKNCDPLASSQITAPDELLAHYVRSELTFLPGMLGLFLGSLFNGALSFLVSNLNSLATVTWEDFVSAAPAFKGVDDKKQLIIIKIIGVIYAILITILSLGVNLVGGVVEGSLVVTAATAGALLGVFVLALAVPLADARATLVGVLAAHTATISLAMIRVVRMPPNAEPLLHLSTQDCQNITLSTAAPSVLNQTLQQLVPLMRVRPTPAPHFGVWHWILEYVLTMSYMWYAVVGTAICVTVAAIVGALAGAKGGKRFDERLLHPMAAKLCRRLPAIKGQRTYLGTADKIVPPIAPGDKVPA